jgi:amino acid transporter
MPELAAQSIGLVGVSGGVGMLIPAVSATAGPHTWVAYVFAIVALLFGSWSISFFARQMASPGALYTFAARGFGLAGALVCGSCLLVAYIIGAAGILLGAVNALAVFLIKAGALGGLPGPGATVALVLLLAVSGAWLSGRDILLSTRVTLLVELLSVGLIAAIVVRTLANAPSLADPRQLGFKGMSLTQLQPGIVLAFFSFVGFESATSLGSEARSPLTAIPRAILISILRPALLFVAASYAMVRAFPVGLQDVQGPLSTMAERQGFGGAGLFVEASIALSFYVAFLSSVNAGARIAYALARDGYLPATIGRSHPVHATPHAAVFGLVGLATCGGVLMLAAGTGLANAYGMLSTIATYGYLAAYLIVAIAAPLYLWRSGRLQWRHGLVSFVAVILLGVPVVGSVYPSPAGLEAVLPYVFAAIVGTHVAAMFAVRRWGRPAASGHGTFGGVSVEQR